MQACRRQAAQAEIFGQYPRSPGGPGDKWELTDAQT